MGRIRVIVDVAATANEVDVERYRGLKKLLAESTLDVSALKDLLEKN